MAEGPAAIAVWFIVHRSGEEQGLLTAVLHRIAARPAVYDALQTIAGAAEVNSRVAARLAQLPAPSTLLDVGGGTGLAQEIWPESARYVCLDLDPLKLSGFRRRHPAGLALVGDATRLPVRSRSLDVVVCKNVSHHLNDSQLPLLFVEAARTLRPGGHLLFEDAVSAPDRWQSRMMWRYDRGSHPRSEEVLKTAIAKQFEIEHWEVFTIRHRYVLGVGLVRAVQHS